MNRILIGELAGLRANLETKYGKKKGRMAYRKVVRDMKGKPDAVVTVIIRDMNRQFSKPDIRPRPTNQRRRRVRERTPTPPHEANDALNKLVDTTQAAMLSFIGGLDTPRPVYKNYDDGMTDLYRRGDLVLYLPLMEKAYILRTKGDRYLIKTENGKHRIVPISDIRMLTFDNLVLQKNDNGTVAKAMKMMNGME